MIKYLLKNHMGALLRATALLTRLPGGNLVFSKLISRWAPFTGTINPRMQKVRSGYAFVAMDDVPGVRAPYYSSIIRPKVGPNSVEMQYRPQLGNPYGSTHAVALAQLGMTCARLKVAEGDLKFFRIAFLKKARGTLTASLLPPEDVHWSEEWVLGSIHDAAGVQVAKFWAHFDRRTGGHTGIHEAALMNLGESATGLAFLTGLPAGAQAILTQLSIDFLHPALGELWSECTCQPPAKPKKRTYRIPAQICDFDTGRVVAELTAEWSVSPIKA